MNDPQRMPPEIAASVFPWDLADEGIEQVLDNFQQLAAVNSVYLCNLSEGTRPFYGGTYPHNPVRETYSAEPGRVYWRPHAEHFKRIKPLPSQRDFLADSDWMQKLIESARRRGMRVGAELFHGYIDQERLNGEFADLRQVDISGQPIRFHDYGNHASCPNNPDFQDYATGLFSDLSAHYDLDYIQTCMIPFVLPVAYLNQLPIKHREIEYALVAPRGAGCFCRHCQAAAGLQGFDLEEALPVLRRLAEQDFQPILASGISAGDYLQEQPLLRRWLEFRRDSVNRLYARLASAAKALRPAIKLRWNHYILHHSWFSGIDLPTLLTHVDSVRVNALAEHAGRMDLIDAKVDYFRGFVRTIPEGAEWLPAIDIRSDKPAVVAASASRLADLGCSGYVLSHYAEAPLPSLAAVRQGLLDSRWRQAIPPAPPAGGSRAAVAATTPPVA